MSAIFTYPDSYVDDTMKMFNGYMERASLLYKLELEGRIDGYVSSSSYLLMEDAKEPFIERMKKAFTKAKDTLIEFIKKVFESIGDTFKKIGDKCNSVGTKVDGSIDDSNIKDVKVEVTDRKKEIDTIIEDRDKLIKLSRDPKSTAKDIKKFMKKHKIKLSEKQRTMVYSLIGSVIISGVKGLYEGYKDGYRNALARMQAQEDALNTISDAEKLHAALDGIMQTNSEMANSIKGMREDLMKINNAMNANGTPATT